MPTHHELVICLSCCFLTIRTKQKTLKTPASPTVKSSVEYTPHMARIFQQSHTGRGEICIYMKIKKQKTYIVFFLQHEGFHLCALSMRVCWQSLGLSVGIFWPNKARHQYGGQIHLCRRHSPFILLVAVIAPICPCFIIVLCSFPQSHPLSSSSSLPPPALFWGCKSATNSMHPVSVCLPNPSHKKNAAPLVLKSFLKLRRAIINMNL